MKHSFLGFYKCGARGWPARVAGHLGAVGCGWLAVLLGCVRCCMHSRDGVYTSELVWGVGVRTSPHRCALLG